MYCQEMLVEMATNQLKISQNFDLDSFQGTSFISKKSDI